jgi:hypothetical protein
LLAVVDVAADARQFTRLAHQAQRARTAVVARHAERKRLFDDRGALARVAAVGRRGRHCAGVSSGLT